MTTAVLEATPQCDPNHEQLADVFCRLQALRETIDHELSVIAMELAQSHGLVQVGNNLRYQYYLIDEQFKRALGVIARQLPTEMQANVSLVAKDVPTSIHSAG